MNEAIIIDDVIKQRWFTELTNKNCVISETEPFDEAQVWSYHQTVCTSSISSITQLILDEGNRKKIHFLRDLVL